MEHALIKLMCVCVYICVQAEDHIYLDHLVQMHQRFEVSCHVTIM